MTIGLQAAHEKLRQAVAAIVSGYGWKPILDVSSKFHRFSFNNQLFIFLQRPDATLVAGYKRWQVSGGEAKRSKGSSRARRGGRSLGLFLLVGGHGRFAALPLRMPCQRTGPRSMHLLVG